MPEQQVTRVQLPRTAPQGAPPGRYQIQNPRPHSVEVTTPDGRVICELAAGRTAVFEMIPLDPGRFDWGQVLYDAEKGVRP